jgi:hypothetical protein
LCLEPDDTVITTNSIAALHHHHGSNQQQQMLRDRQQTPTLMTRQQSAPRLMNGSGTNLHENVYTKNANNRVMGRPPLPPPNPTCARPTISSKMKHKNSGMGARNMSGDSLIDFEEALKLEPPDSAQKIDVSGSGTMKRRATTMKQSSPFGSASSLFGGGGGQVSQSTIGDDVKVGGDGGGAPMTMMQPKY